MPGLAVQEKLGCPKFLTKGSTPTVHSAASYSWTVEGSFESVAKLQNGLGVRSVSVPSRKGRGKDVLGVRRCYVRGHYEERKL